MSQSVRLGFFSALGAYIIWGLLPLYFKALPHIEPELMLAHRIIWSLPTGLLLLGLAGALPELKAAWNRKMLLWLGVSSMLIASNWLVYIWAVGQDRVLEASLGYYINPLVNVAIGALFLGEALRRMQWVAVGLAAIGVVVMTIALNAVPTVSLFLCFSFGGYALIRKYLQIDGRAGFVVEAAILFPLAMIWLLQFSDGGGAVWGHGTPRDIGLLILSGPLTALPLILFALAAKRLTFATVGMMQYIGPTLQFLLAILVFQEVFQLTQGLAFAFIWIALLVFSYDSLKTRTPRPA
ncbi:MAG: EamA family transporter RarD [Hyphomonadaceae bacterium]